MGGITSLSASLKGTSITRLSLRENHFEIGQKQLDFDFGGTAITHLDLSGNNLEEIGATLGRS